jgi:hypothetical protein
MPLSEANLQQRATQFRLALEEYLRQHPDVNLSTNIFNPTRAHFPHDCCKSTSWLFGHYLSQSVPKSELEYVWGKRSDGDHGWLQHNGYIIDLTADQFEGEDRKAIVERVGNSPLHLTFAPHKIHPFQPSPGHMFGPMAAEIASLIPAAETGTSI